jgi:multidrug efflux pump
VLAQADAYFRKQPGVARTIAVAGFSFSGNGQNAGLAFIPLKDWKERGPEQSAQAIAQRAPRRCPASGRDHLPAQPAADPRTG